MNNAEIRKRALSKVKVKNLTFMVVISYLLICAVGLLQNAFENRATNDIVSIAALFVLAFATGAGLARTSISAWRQGQAKWCEYAAYYKDPALLTKAIPGALTAALAGMCSLSVIYMIRPAEVILMAALGEVLIVFAKYQFYAIELTDGKDGFSVLIKNALRVWKMELSLKWWIYAVQIAAYLLTAVAGGQGMIGASLVAFLVGVVLKWAVGSFIELAQAGLARELFI